MIHIFFCDTNFLSKQTSMTAKAMYLSLKEQQQHEQKQSDFLLINGSKASHASCIEPYPLAMFIMGYDPWIVGKAMYVQGSSLSLYPANMQKNDHLVVVKCKNTLEDATTKYVIRTLVQHLPYEQIDKFIHIIKKRVATHPSSRYAEIHSLRFNRNNWKSTAYKAFSLWFDKTLMGAWCITRALSINRLHHKMPSLALANEITRTIMGLGNMYHNGTFWKFDSKYLIVTDSRMYPLTQEESDKLNYPTKVNADYVEIYDSTQYVNGKDEEYFGNSDVWNLDRNSNDPDTQYAMGISEEIKTKSKRVKIIYGDKVFAGYLSGLREIANSTRFNLWSQHNGIEVWCGRDEEVKIEDYRRLKRRIKRMEEENKKLRQQLNQS